MWKNLAIYRGFLPLLISALFLFFPPSPLSFLNLSYPSLFYLSYLSVVLHFSPARFFFFNFGCIYNATTAGSPGDQFECGNRPIRRMAGTPPDRRSYKYVPD